MTRTEQAFHAGYTYGQVHGDATAREAGALNQSYNHHETEAFCQGSIDGATDDTWRLAHIATA